MATISPNNDEPYVIQHPRSLSLVEAAVIESCAASVPRELGTRSGLFPGWEGVPVHRLDFRYSLQTDEHLGSGDTVPFPNLPNYSRVLRFNPRNRHE